MQTAAFNGDVEVLTFHPGPLQLTLKNGDSGKIACRETGETQGGRPVYVTKVSGAVAEHLLGAVGKPSFWKGTVVAAPAKQEHKETKEDPPATLTEEGFSNVKPNNIKAVLKQCEDKVLMMKLLAGETQTETPRAYIVNALQARIDELSK